MHNDQVFRFVFKIFSKLFILRGKGGWGGKAVRELMPRDLTPPDPEQVSNGKLARYEGKPIPKEKDFR